MELVTILELDDSDSTFTERFKVGANVRGVTSEEIALNGFSVTVGDIRVETGLSTLSAQIEPNNYVRRSNGTEYKIQSIDDSVRGRRGLFASGS